MSDCDADLFGPRHSTCTTGDLFEEDPHMRVQRIVFLSFDCHCPGYFSIDPLVILSQSGDSTSPAIAVESEDILNVAVRCMRISFVAPTPSFV